MAKLLVYQPFFSEAVLSFFHGLPKRRRKMFLDASIELASDPFLTPDESSRDSDGREICHVMANGFIFTYWVDHAEKRVMVTEVEGVN